jgi:putative two-component system response regulator
MIDALDPIEEILVSPASPPEEVERALAELARVLDPRLRGPSPQNALIFARALKLLVEPPARVEGPALAECLISMAVYALYSGQALKGLAPAQRAVDLLRRLGSRRLLREALTVHGALLADTGNLPVAIETYVEALEIAIELEDALAQAKLWTNLGAALTSAAQYPDAIACLERVAAVTEGHDECPLLLRGAALTNIALARLHLEDYADGLHAAKTGIELQDNPVTAPDCLARTISECNYARLLLEVDAVETARQHCEIAKHFARESGLERAELEAGMVEGLCEVYSGAVDIGLSRLDKWLQKARVLKRLLADALIAVVKANEVADRHDVALGYLRELMKHTRQVRQEHALLHHRLHIQQLARRQTASVADSEELLEHHEITLLAKVATQAAQREMVRARIEMLERLAVVAN